MSTQANELTNWAQGLTQEQLELCIVYITALIPEINDRLNQGKEA
jgi:hypothetical protein